MVAPEAIGPLQRYAALVAEQPVIRLAEPLARQLGLREGQIVQASLQMEADGVALKLEERLFMLPPGWQRYASGDLRWFQVVRTPTGLALKMMSPSAAGGASASVAPGALPEVSGATLQQSPASAMTSAPLATRGLFAELSSLLSRPSGFEALFNVLKPGVLESALLGLRSSAQWASAMAALRASVDNLTAQSIRQAAWASGQFSEAILAAGRGGAAVDLKMVLRQALRTIGSRSPLGEQIEASIDEIERSQVDSILAQTDQRQVMSLMLPFVDAEPALLRFERQPRSSERSPQRYVIDLHIRPAAIGDLWIKTAVAEKTVDLTVWTTRPEVAQLVQRFRDELGVDLGEAGLVLQGFRVIEAPRTSEEPPMGPAGRTSLDIRA